MTTRRLDRKTTAPRKAGDATSAILISVIACLVLTILFLGTPDSALLTPEWINTTQVWSP
jgi:hypothetical protein